MQFSVPPEGLSFRLSLWIFLKQSSFHGLVSCKFSRVMLCSGRVRWVGCFLLVYSGRPISLSVLLGCFWLSCRWLKRFISCILTYVLRQGFLGHGRAFVFCYVQEKIHAVCQHYRAVKSVTYILPTLLRHNFTSLQPMSIRLVAP